jgi:predicted dienelactone hydrolase
VTRDRAIRTRRLLALGLLLGVAAAVAVLIATAQQHPPSGTPPGEFAVGVRVLSFTDPTRTIQLPNGTSAPRTLVTIVRYPALGAPGSGELRNAPPASGAGPFPLLLFGHGFAVTPTPYSPLLRAWARAGYVVAAPLFPLENAAAPGRPNESDLSNQPADMRFLISRMLAAGGASGGPLAGMVDSGRIAVSGQSDGGDTALAAAYDPRYRDPRIGAAVILSGAEIPGLGSFTFPTGGPPLLAVQGTADTINPPALTDFFFGEAHRPKFLLRLPGAEHLPPYTGEQPQLQIVARVSLAFLDGYLRKRPGAVARMTSLGSVAGTAELVAEP